MNTELNHFDAGGNAIMVDVSEKDTTAREALASGIIKVSPAVLSAIRSGASKKGDVLAVSRIAGILAAKRTWELIPLCHPLSLQHCSVDFTVEEERSQIRAVCRVCVEGKTGVEMEALTGVSVALLTIYDMCKAIDRTMEISAIRLEQKSGGKSGVFCREKA
ncbi:MAG: cyclic pyranopterin monophosphate synthase MoaC [Oscillospiraceae bacterium]|jgi:cyclic pyranopterin phosphate synthase|nr:cyclic pyranopterin monophosphate synthase MoaC [Oscillospiraceae bacterium]